MIKFNILNRFSGAVQFTAEIDCSDDEYNSFKVGLAVRWAVNNGANLGGADLRSADLGGANLRSADLRSADLRSADLGGANLRSANLLSADLRSADLRSANLRSANLGGANLRSADLRSANLGGANLGGADLRSADLRSANLRSANLRSADLRSADLRSADLRGADLGGANLGGADLRSADLGSARGLLPCRVQPLLMLLEQPGKIRAYKLVSDDYRSPMQLSNRIKYEIGGEVEAEANTDVHDLCAAGVNVATLDWCLKEWCEGWRILVVEFEAKDIACIPTASDGKFRLHRCAVVGEKDLTEYFPKEEPETEEQEEPVEE